ncbi:anthranilate synthase component I [Sutcliffiella cohnii]
MMKKIPTGISFPFPQEKFFRQYKTLVKKKRHHILLESGRGGRYCIVGMDPVATIKGKGEKLQITSTKGTEVLEGNPLESMKNWMSQHRSETLEGFPPFSGGAIGYFTYDCMRYIEKIENIAEDDLKLPDLYFLLFDDVFVLDKETETLYIIVHEDLEEDGDAIEKLRYYEGLWQSEQEQPPIYSYEPLSSSSDREVSLSEEKFIEAVEKIKQYIEQGDVFQVNLSVRQAEPLHTHPIEVYSKLREFNPSPYMGYLHFPEFQIVSGSPELLVKKDGDEISTRPIAGTRSRGKTEAEDFALATELIENEKERAEHVMLVDLERNDLGRVAQYGTVEVNEFMVIEKYSHVMHIVSNVRGKLRSGQDTFDLIKATFPGGTITGAPKVRTMEIIEELEPVRRSVYTGSIGWIGYNGDTELNIAIRTMVVKDGWAYVQAGAGIVIDSVPKREYKESLKKAAALWKAKQLSEDERFFREELER